MKDIVSISLVGCALSLVARGGLLNKLLGDVSIEINACPQLAIDLSGNPSQDSPPVFQSSNPACPNYLPPSEPLDAVSSAQNVTSATPTPGLDAAATVYPGGYEFNPQQLPILVNSMLPVAPGGAHSPMLANPSTGNARPGVNYSANNPQQLVDNAAAVNTAAGPPARMPGSPDTASTPSGSRYSASNPQPLVDNAAAINTAAGPPARAPGNPSSAATPSGPRYSAAIPQQLVDNAAAVNTAGGPPAWLPGSPGAAVMPSSPRYNAANQPLPPVQPNNLPPLVADTAAAYAGKSPAALDSVRYNTAVILPVPTQFADLPLVDDEADTRPDVVSTPNPAVPLVWVDEPFVPAVIPTTTPASVASTTTTCTHRGPANGYRSSALQPAGAQQAAPALPANTASAIYSGATPVVAPASARQPINPTPIPAHPVYGNTYGAAAAAPTALAAPRIPRIPMSTADGLAVGAPRPAGHFVEQNIDATVTVTALADLPPRVLHAMRHMGAFEFTS
ncbi:hypothetical protein GGI21_000453 [Coemansia aciculifera]|nr:hypothetical protein GGI21_000453 [Coemansia aciculifera]